VKITRRWVGVAAVFMLLASAVPAFAHKSDGYLTPQDPLLALADHLPSASSVTAIINSGDQLGDFEFRGIPDGVGIMPGPTKDTVDVFVAHEESTVPFFGFADQQDASVSRLTLDRKTGAVLDAAVVLGPEEGFLRFCSAFMAGPDEGFDNYTFFLNEESNDVIEVPDGAAYGADPAFAPDNLRQAGYAVALRPETGEFSIIQGMGRLNHENTIALPNWGNRKVILTTDDTFAGPSAQLYMYLADNEDDLWEDEGSLWAFQVTAVDGHPVDPGDAFNGANDYVDLDVGEVMSGRFIPVPDDIADGITADAPQDALENWSNANNVFQFIRLEDLAYDRNDPHKVYIADTGRNRVVPDPATGRLMRGPTGTVGLADNGSMFVMEFNPGNPKVVDAFYVLAQGDDPNRDAYVPFRAPDNVDTSRRSLMVQEDADDAKIWRHNLRTGGWDVVATVTDPDGESSGITWAPDSFGQGHWLVTIQGHGANVAEEVIDGVTVKTESGQLVLMRIPGT